MNDDEKLEPCSYDPIPDIDLGMFHCPECGEMVVGGVGHPRYWEADAQDELDDVTERVTKAAADGDIGLAAQDIVVEYEEIVSEIWDALDLGPALITDMSSLRHFGLDREEALTILEDRFGIDLSEQYDLDFADLLPYIAENRLR